jgi:hypothetical protein
MNPPQRAATAKSPLLDDHRLVAGIGPESWGVFPKRHIPGRPILSVEAVLPAAISSRQQGFAGDEAASGL